MSADSTFNYQGEYDENWPLPSRLTLDQYHRVIFRPDAHFVDGEIIARNLGDSMHSSAIGSLIRALHPTCSTHQYHCCISLRLQVSATRVRVCDFVVLEDNAPREPVPTVPPLLCIETLAQGQTPLDEIGTLADYLAMGVPNIWVVDPVVRKVYIYKTDGSLELADHCVAITGTHNTIDIATFFSGQDQEAH